MGLSAGLIDDLLLLPQDYRSSSPGGEGNSSERSRGKQREARGQREREGERDGGRESACVRLRVGGGVGLENGRKYREGQVGGKTEDRRD